jgi:hypothetical protein
VRFAYRRFGAPGATALVMLQRFRAIKALRKEIAPARATAIAS